MTGRTAPPVIDSADDAASRERLRQAMVGEAGFSVGLSDLIRAESQEPGGSMLTSREPLALLPGTSVDSGFCERKEAQDVVPAD